MGITPFSSGRWAKYTITRLSNLQKISRRIDEFAIDIKTRLKGSWFFQVFVPLPKKISFLILKFPHKLKAFRTFAAISNPVGQIACL